jgi:hypothetical protein
MRIKTQIKGGQNVRAALRKLRGNMKGPRNVLVGVPEGTGNYKDGAQVAVIAAVNHFGSADGRVPARPFLDVAIKENEQKYTKIAEEMLPQVAAGDMEFRQALDTIGLVAASDVQEKIVEIRTPPNAPSTIARKGSSNPLIHNSHMLQSITHIVADESDRIEEGL